MGACAGIIAGALLALWDLAAARCARVGFWCVRAVSGSLSSSSVHSGPDGSSQHYYQAVTDDLPSEYWVCCPHPSVPLLLPDLGRSSCVRVDHVWGLCSLLHSCAMTNSLLCLLLLWQLCFRWQRPLKWCFSWLAAQLAIQRQATI